MKNKTEGAIQMPFSQGIKYGKYSINGRYFNLKWRKAKQRIKNIKS